MSCDPRGPVEIIRRGNNYFRRWRPACDSDCLYLRAGETDWHGPFPTEGDWATEQRWEHRFAIKRAARLGLDGVPLQVQIVGAYIRTRLLHEGPAKKLSDWKQLSPGSHMLVNPYPTADDVEKALNRVTYMRQKGCGDYRSWTDDVGALWVERL
jgi:hypothetical protein